RCLLAGRCQRDMVPRRFGVDSWAELPALLARHLTARTNMIDHNKIVAAGRVDDSPRQRDAIETVVLEDKIMRPCGFVVPGEGDDRVLPWRLSLDRHHAVRSPRDEVLSRDGVPVLELAGVDHPIDRLCAV